VSATNLFDKDYFAPCRTFGDCFSGNGRSVIATLGYRF
jgi:iron complex outermembrane receptor protein